MCVPATYHRGRVHSAPLLLTCDTFQAPPLFVSVTVNCDFVPFEPGRFVPSAQGQLKVADWKDWEAPTLEDDATLSGLE